MSRIAHRVLLAALALALVAASCGGKGEATLGRPVPTETSSAGVPGDPVAVPGALIARARPAVANLAVYDAPGDPDPVRLLENPWVVDPAFPDQVVPQVFLVKEQRADGWTRVLLPVRPNGSSGWVRTDDVQITPTSYRIRVELGAHLITVTDGETVLYQGVVAVGTDATPTPPGEYYIRVKIQAIEPDTVYGPFAWGLSSHSEVLETFNGGDAEIGIHGNNDASVLGQSVTSGCVRMDNDWITRLTGLLPLGTPVDIVA